MDDGSVRTPNDPTTWPLVTGHSQRPNDPLRGVLVPVDLGDVIGRIPYRVALAGGWIDQPFASRLDPEPPGSMVVVSLQPTVRLMDRCGMATGTRKVAVDLWGERLPEREPAE